MPEFKLKDMSKWARKSTRRMEAVMQNTVERVCERAQTPVDQGGKMPVVTSTLRNSFMSSLNGSTALSGPASYLMVVNDFGAGDLLEFGWGGLAKDYAARVNFGYVGTDELGRNINQSGKHFMEYGTRAFKRIFREECAKAEAIVGG